MPCAGPRGSAARSRCRSWSSPGVVGGGRRDRHGRGGVGGLGDLDGDRGADLDDVAGLVDGQHLVGVLVGLDRLLAGLEPGVLQGDRGEGPVLADEVVGHLDVAGRVEDAGSSSPWRRRPGRPGRSSSPCSSSWSGVFSSWKPDTTKPCFSSSARAASLSKPVTSGTVRLSGPVDTTYLTTDCSAILVPDLGSWLMTSPSVTVVLGAVDFSPRRLLVREGLRRDVAPSCPRSSARRPASRAGVWLLNHVTAPQPTRAEHGE